MANTTDVPVGIRYPEQCAIYVTFTRNDQTYEIPLRIYTAHSGGRKRCSHTEHWFENVNLKSSNIFSVQLDNPHDDDYLDSSGKTIYEVLLETMPTTTICTEDMEFVVPLPSQAGIICASTKTAYVFGVLWRDLESALMVRRDVKSRLMKMMGVAHKRCLLPMVHLPDDSKTECVPIDMLPFVLGLFNRSTRSIHRSLVDRIMWTVYRNVVANAGDIGIAGINLARLASLTSIMDWYRRVQSIAFHDVLDKIDRAEIAMTRINQQRAREVEEKIILHDDVRRMKHSIQMLVKQNNQMMVMLAKQDDVIASMGGHVYMDTIVPPRGVPVSTATKFQRNIKSKDFLEKLDSIKEHIRTPDPRASLLEAMYKHILAETLPSGKADPTWFLVFQTVCSLCRAQDPRLSEIKAAFDKWNRKRNRPDTYYFSPTKRQRSLNDSLQKDEAFEGESE